jgi:hypothetical protein
MFVNTLRRVPDLSPYGLLLHEKPIDPRAIQRQVALVKKRFRKLREKDLYIRDRFKREARDLITAVDGLEEKRFLASLMSYFVDDGWVAPRTKMLDFYVALIETTSGDHVFRSPALFVEERISQIDDPAEIRRIIDSRRNLLNQQFTDVSSSFLALHRAILRERM